MVWNEETSQKPAEDTVKDMKGDRRSFGKTRVLEIDRKELLRTFEAFEAAFSAFSTGQTEQERNVRSGSGY